MDTAAKGALPFLQLCICVQSMNGRDAYAYTKIIFPEMARKFLIELYISKKKIYAVKCLPLKIDFMRSDLVRHICLTGG